MEKLHMQATVIDISSICRRDRSNLEHIGITSITSINRESEMKKDLRSSEMVADLTWANLYARRIRQDLIMLTPAVKKIAASGELGEIVAKLRNELEAVHRTLADLRKLTQSARSPRRQVRSRSGSARPEGCTREPLVLHR
jgi:hypothetical protein